jgi:GAF domain-containing protein
VEKGMTGINDSPAFLAEGGAMGARMRAHDWAATPLGPPDTWPSSLTAVVRVMLTSRFAMWMAWGAELIFFCNDAYLPTTGIKRDWVLGARSDRVWAEIWPDTAVHGLAPGVPAAAATVGIHAADAAWPFGRVLQTGAEVVAVAPKDLGDLRLEHWQSVPDEALVVPIVGAEGGTPVGFLVTGLNPHRALDAGCRGFIELVAGQLAAAIARTGEYGRERARAEAPAQIDRAKTAFFSNVSHEFRKPLTLMLGPLEDALADPALARAQVERIATAHRNGVRLLRLVNGPLDFSRIQAGRVEASFQPTDLAAYTVELASAFRSAFRWCMGLPCSRAAHSAWRARSAPARRSPCGCRLHWKPPSRRRPRRPYLLPRRDTPVCSSWMMRRWCARARLNCCRNSATR